MTAKDLKNALLQEAVQGKLVPQIASEGNAKDLLEEIRKERGESLPLAPARKRSSATPSAGSNAARNARFAPITEDEIPFEIPENWCWCRLGEICNEIKRGKSPKYADKSNFLAFAQKCNVKTGGIDLSLALYLDEKSIGRYSEADNLVQDDIVINSTGGGTMGRVGLYETKVPSGIKGVYPDSHVTVIRSIGDIDQHYLYYFLKLNQPILEKCGTGSTNQTELKPAVLENFLVSLPPLAEQKRIVAAIEKFMPLIEEYGKKETELKALNEQIGTLTKKAILQEAVQGKLVPQIAAEGNAKDLLEEIKREKAKLIKEGKFKKEKPLPEITEDEIPFDIPENWCWCRLEDLGDFVRGSGIKRDETTNKGYPCVRYGEMYTTYKIRFSKTKSFTSKDVFEKCHKIHKNDVLMALTGENKWDIALAATYEGVEELALGGDLCKFTPINCNSLFLVYLINSPYGIEYKRNTSTGDIIVHTSTTKLGNFIVPFPPLVEQKRIVAAIEQLLPLCEKLGE